MDPGATKAFLTTTSEFAPGVYKEFEEYIPNRLVLRPRGELLPWLKDLAAKGSIDLRG